MVNQLRISDSLVNFTAQLGTERDKAHHASYAFEPLSAEQLLTAYRSSWLPKKIVDIPALDAVRRWRAWSAEKTDISAIEAEERKHNLRQKVLSVSIASRLFGGAALYINVGDTDTAQPLDPERIALGGLKSVQVMPRQFLSPEPVSYDMDSEWFNQHEFFRLVIPGRAVMEQRIHASRFAIFRGNLLPEGEQVIHSQLWGDSVLQAALDACLKSDATVANVASLVYESKVDVIKIPGFMSNMGDLRMRELLLERVSLAATAKGNNGTLLLDKDEEYESKGHNFGGLDTIIDKMCMISSGAADIPLTRLYGISPGGLSSTGESDMRNYYDRVQSHQELFMTPSLWRLDECLIRSALGSRNEDIFYEWNSLWQSSEKERAEIGKLTAETVAVIKGTALFSDEVMAEVMANAIIESGTVPGFEAAIDNAGGIDNALREEDDSTDEELAAAAGLPPPESGQEPFPRRAPVTDAQPRTLYVRRDVTNQAALQRWARSQGFTDIVDDMHITITYSRASVDWMKMGQFYSDTVVIPEGGPRVVEELGGGAKVLLVTSDEIRWRHELMRERGASFDWPEYQPHITISYGPMPEDVQPYTGPIELGPEIFEEVKQ